MPFNILLLPLLGGYIFIIKWNRTRFDARRQSGNKLILNAAIAGTLLVAFSLGAVYIIDYCVPKLSDLWKTIIPFPYSGTSTLAFLLGSSIWWPLNKIFFKRSKEITRVIQESNDFLEMLLEKALQDTKQISVTLASGKVYIGFVTSNFDPSFDRKYLKILPLLSGYRNEADKSVVITTDYTHVYENVIDDEQEFAHLNPDDFEIVISVNDVLTVNIFDPDAYRLFNSPIISES